MFPGPGEYKQNSIFNSKYSRKIGFRIKTSQKSKKHSLGPG